MRRVIAFAALLGALVVGTGLGAARTTQATVGVYPAGTSFTAAGAAPARPASSIALSMPIGAVDDAVLLARGAQHVSAPTALLETPLSMRLLFAHYVSVHGKLVPDALEPWDGSSATEQTNQPIWVQITVPQGTPPGTYTGSINLVTDGTPHDIPISVKVADVTIPPPGQVPGSLLTAFNFSPQSYEAEVNKLYGKPASQSLPGLFSFLAAYRLSPNNWGYGNPESPSGYTSGGGWSHSKAARMTEAVGAPRQFSSMWIPVSNQRTAANNWVGGISPYKPETWCSYLKSVKGFWENENWMPGAYPYLLAMDEPGRNLFPVVGRQAAAVHSCWPGSHVVVTGKPGTANRSLWNGGADDVDVWSVLSSRYYGEYTTPSQQQRGINRSRMFLRYINAARKRGKHIWTYTYSSKANDTPGLTAIEPVADARMLVEWAALEGISGLSRGQGLTSYTASVNPLVANDRSDGDYVLIYPGRNAPIASARLEELRAGIEDWAILDIVRHKHGSAAVVKLLSGLFSTTATGAKLACSIGCPIKSSHPYSWPLWSKGGRTAAKLAHMRAAALASAAS